MNELLPIAAIDLFGLTLVALPAAAGMAAVALIGYIFGTRTRSSSQAEIDGRRQRELERASRIAWQLETIADRLRQDLASHHSQVELFKRRLRKAQSDGSEQSWKQLCEEAELVLGPTMQMAQRLSQAYDEIRQQSEALETFAQGRTDQLTGVGNGRALESQLEVMLNSAARGPVEFVVAIVSLDRAEHHGGGATKQLSLLPKLAGVIRTCMRDTDFVARLGDEEFVVVMPQTSLAGASVFGDRLRTRVSAELNASICCGLTAAVTNDDTKSLLARADSALYSARASGRSRMFVHTGSQIREHRTNLSGAAELMAARPERESMNPIAADPLIDLAIVTPSDEEFDVACELVGVSLERD